MTESEQWRPVVGWEGLYEVSDRGQVRSLRRQYVNRNGVLVTKGARTLKPTLQRGGYPRVNLLDRDRSEYRYVHQLVLEAFVGPRPAGMVTLHRNGDASDCRIENLHWGTQQENMQDRLRHGTHHNASKTHCQYGHPLDESNTIWRTDHRIGSRTRECHTCRIERTRRKSTAAIHTKPPQTLAVGEVYGREWNGRMSYLLISNALYELPDAVMTQKCDERGELIDNKIRWTSRDTLRKFWTKAGYAAAQIAAVR